MTKKELRKSLDYTNHSRQKRQEMASMIMANPDLMQPLMEIAFDVTKPISCKACWVMEYTVKKQSILSSALYQQFYR